MRLKKLARSAPITVVAMAAMFNLIACALPKVKPRMAPEFASGKTKVKTITLLPVDLNVQVEGTDHMVRSDQGLGVELMERIYNGVSKSLRKRGYKVTSFVEPDGRTHHSRKMVIHPNDLSALRVEIHDSTSFQKPGPGYIGVSVSSALTKQIQAKTGADASLYARGWIYVGQEDSAALTAVKIIGITIFAVVIVGLLVMWLASAGKGGKSKSKSKFKSSKRRSRSSSSSRGLGKAFFNVGRAVARTAATVGRVTVRVLPHILEAASEAHAHRAYVDVPCHTCAPPPPPPAPPPPPPAVADEPGVVEGEDLPPTAMPAPPKPQPHEAAPVKQARDAEKPPVRHLSFGKAPAKSTVSLAVSLVQNKSGRVLWHAGQSFEVKVDKNYNMQAFIDHFFAELPRAGE